MTNTPMIALIRAIAPMTEHACDNLSDAIIATESPRYARAALFLARLYDPHAAFHAAHIRDTIRDNI